MIQEDELDWVDCPECGTEQADMGRNVCCEECGWGPMPYHNDVGELIDPTDEAWEPTLPASMGD